jgi:hypothetical protein
VQVWALLADRLGAILAAHGQIASEYPFWYGVYFAGLAACVLGTVFFVWRDRAPLAFWCAAGAVVISFSFSWGDDSYTHIYRIAALADQVRTNSYSAFLSSPTTGEGVPTFVFYGQVPYVVPVALDLLGLPAAYAFKIWMVLLFLVMVAGVQVLMSVALPSVQLRARFFLAAILFLSANYVFSLWCSRASLGEVWVYIFMPWAVASALRPTGTRWLVLFFFLQVCGHPIVLGQSLVAEALAIWCLSGLPVRDVVKRTLPALLAAILLGVPFWLPQALWQGAILGPQALPTRFVDSFLTIADVLRIQHIRTIGLWLPLAVVMLAFSTGKRLSRYFWLPVLVAAVTTALEMRPLASVASHIPTLDLSLFVWRLALPVAFILFAALVSGLREARETHPRGLVTVTTLAVLTMTFVLVQSTPHPEAPLGPEWRQDRFVLLNFDRYDGGIWGVREYWPQYDKTATGCEVSEAARVSYRDLQAGVEATGPYLLVRHGPVRLVDYLANGLPVQPRACGEDLILGPLPAGAHVAVSELRMNWLTLVRAVDFLLALLMILFLGRHMGLVRHRAAWTPSFGWLARPRTRDR